jgi:signal transduction histidine kinase
VFTIPLTGWSLDSEYLITDNEGTVVLTTLPAQFPAGKRLNELIPSLAPGAPAKTTRIYSSRHEVFLAAPVPLGSSPVPGGMVLSFARASNLEALNREILLLLLKSLLLAFAVAVPVAIILARYLLRPLKTLCEYAKALAGRRFDLRLEIKTDDELADLADAFNEMAHRLEKHDVSMWRFLQSASHELKTPLMSIQGYAEGIKDGVFTGDELDHALDAISRASQRLKSVVDELIYLSQLENPGEAYTLTPLNLNRLLVSVVDSLGGYAAEKKVRLSVKVPTGMDVIGDEEKLHRLFGNILANAIRHAAGKVDIQAVWVPDSTQGRILFHDDGEGFGSKDLEHAFDYFYRGPHGSTGLGLSIARIIAQAHNGRIEIYNSAAGGAVVEVTLPLKRLYGNTPAENA